MSEEQNTFKVTDRRLFNPDGTPREPAPEERQEVPPATTVSTSSPTPAVTQPRGSESAAQTRTSPSDKKEEPEAADEVEPADPRDPASFVNFVMSIASNAASALGMMEHPVTHEREVDLELAKHWIDVLGMLQHKTRGNLSPQEQHILEGLLSDLRMQYVSLANSPQAKVARSYTGRDIVGGK